MADKDSEQPGQIGPEEMEEAVGRITDQPDH